MRLLRDGDPVCQVSLDASSEQGPALRVLKLQAPAEVLSLLRSGVHGFQLEFGAGDLRPLSVAAFDAGAAGAVKIIGTIA